MLYAVDAEDGTEVWTFDTGHRGESSPTVADGIVYIGSGAASSDDGALYAVNANNGNEQWSFEAGSISVSSPTIVDNPSTGKGIGSRTQLRTLGHHSTRGIGGSSVGMSNTSEGIRDQRNQTGEQGNDNDTDSEPDEDASVSSESTPGFGFISGISALGAFGYMLKRQLSEYSE